MYKKSQKAVVRIRGRDFAVNSVSSATAAFAVASGSITVNTADFATNLLSYSTTFQQWRVKNIRFSAFSPTPTRTGLIAVACSADPDRGAPTTMSEMIQLGGDIANATQRPPVVVFPHETPWLKTTVGSVNTDVRFYQAGRYYLAVQYADGTNALAAYLKVEYDVEFCDPI